MKLLCLPIIFAALTATGCTNHHHNNDDTPECMKYRAMMTAPISPAAADDLKKRCEQSRQIL